MAIEQRQRKLWRIRTKLGPGAVVRAKVTSRTCRSSSRDGHRFGLSKAAPTSRIGGGGAPGNSIKDPSTSYIPHSDTHTHLHTHHTHTLIHTRPVISRPWLKRWIDEWIFYPEGNAGNFVYCGAANHRSGMYQHSGAKVASRRHSRRDTKPTAVNR